VANIGSIDRSDMGETRYSITDVNQTKMKNAPALTGAFSIFAVRSGSHFGDFGCLRALLPLDDLELHSIALGERLEAASLDGAEVNEDVGPPFSRDESVPLRIVEPLHSASKTSHDVPLAEEQ